MTKHVAILESESSDSDSSDSVVVVPYEKPQPPLISLSDSEDDEGSSTGRKRDKSSKHSKSTTKQKKSKDKSKSPTKTTSNSNDNGRSRLDNNSTSQKNCELRKSKNPAKRIRKRCSDKQSESLDVVQGNQNQGTSNSETKSMDMSTTNRNVELGALIPSSVSVNSLLSSTVSNDVHVQVPGDTTQQSTDNSNGLNPDPETQDCPIQITISNSIFETPPPKPKRKRNPPNPDATTKKKSANDFERFLKEINLPIPKALQIVTPRTRKKRLPAAATAMPVEVDSMTGPIQIQPILLGDPNEINIQEHDVSVEGMDTTTPDSVTRASPDSTVQFPTTTCYPEVPTVPVPDSSTSPQGVVNVTNEPSSSTSKNMGPSKKKQKLCKNQEEQPGFTAEELESVSDKTIMTNILTTDANSSISPRSSSSKKQGQTSEKSGTPKPKRKSKSPTKRKRPVLNEEIDEEEFKDFLWGADHDSSTLIIPPQDIFPGVSDEELYMPKIEMVPPNWTPEMREFYGAVRPELLEFDFRNIVRGQSSNKRLWKAPVDDGLPPPKRKRVYCHRCRSSHEINDCHRQGPRICSMCGRKHHLSNLCPNRICLNCGARNPQGNRRFPVGCKQCLWNKKLPPCSICKVVGHTEYLCPDNWRRYHSTTIDIPEAIKGFHSMKSNIDMTMANWKFHQAQKRKLVKKIDEMQKKFQSQNPGTSKQEKGLLSAQAELNKILVEIDSARGILENFKSKVEDFKKQVYPSLQPRLKVNTYCCNCTTRGHNYFQCGAPRFQESRNFPPSKAYVIREVAKTLSFDQIENIKDILDTANFDLDTIETELLDRQVEPIEIDAVIDKESEAVEKDKMEEAPEIEIIEENVVLAKATEPLKKLKTSSIAPLEVNPTRARAVPQAITEPESTTTITDFQIGSTVEDPVHGPSISSPFHSFPPPRQPSSIVATSNSIFQEDIIEPNFDVDERIHGPNGPIQSVFLGPGVFPFPPPNASVSSNSGQLPLPPPLNVGAPECNKIPILLYVSPEELHRYAPVRLNNEGATAFLPPPVPQWRLPLVPPPPQPVRTMEHRQSQPREALSTEITAPDSTTPTKSNTGSPISRQPQNIETSPESPDVPRLAIESKKWNESSFARERLITYLETELKVKMFMDKKSIRITEGDITSRKIARRNMESFLDSTRNGTKFIPDLTERGRRDSSSPEIIEFDDQEREVEQSLNRHHGRRFEWYDNSHRRDKEHPTYRGHVDKYNNNLDRGGSGGRGRVASYHSNRRYFDRPSSNEYYNNRDRDSREDRGGRRQPPRSPGSGRHYSNSTSPSKESRNRPRRYYHQD